MMWIWNCKSVLLTLRLKQEKKKIEEKLKLQINELNLFKDKMDVSDEGLLVEKLSKNLLSNFEV